MDYFLGLIVRCKDEPYINEFVEYYLNQGVDKIYIVDDNSDKTIYNEVKLNEKIIVIYGNSITKMENEFDGCKKLYKQIKNNFEWLIIVDMDEFITTKKNPNETIKQSLMTTFKDADCIKIPWVMMSCNGIEKNPSSLLKTNVYRWNHDLKHHNNLNIRKFRCRYTEIEVKCIFKPRSFSDIFYHHPLKPVGKVIITDSIKNKPSELNPYHRNLREQDILEGHLLCYHYRIVSVENCLNKIKNNLWYKKYTLKDLLSNDYPEVIDNRLTK